MAGLLYVVLTLDVTDGTGAPVNRGLASLAPSAQLVDTTDNLLVAQAPVGGQFTGAGSPSVRLLATDNPNLAPSGWAWDISFIVVPGRPAPFSFFLPAGPVAFTATDASPAVFTFTPAPALTALPDSTGVQLSGGSLPGGFVQNQTYYVVNAAGVTFELAATVNGSPLASSSTGSGSLTVASYYLSSLTPVASVTTMQAYMPLPSGIPAAGQVPVALGAGEASAWGFPATYVTDDDGGYWLASGATMPLLSWLPLLQDQSGALILDQAGGLLI